MGDDDTTWNAFEKIKEATLEANKQSILKAIMERKPKIEHDDWEHDCDGCSILGERRGIERYESVIKEVLR